MKQQVTNFSRFYRAFNRLEHSTDEVKSELVRKFTNGRTGSLKEIETSEYDNLCRCLEISVGMNDGSVPYDELRRRRSEVLHLMQKIGVDTTDWSRVDEFCQHSKIAGQRFRLLSASDLENLSTKLRAIERHGGLKKYDDDQQDFQQEKVQETAPKKAKRTFVMLPLFTGDQLAN